MNIKDNFFCFTRRVEVVPGEKESAINVINGVAWDSIERFYTDENAKLNIIVKSMTETYQWNKIPEGNKVVDRLTKMPINVIIVIAEAEDIRRFLEYMGVSPATEEAK